MNRENDKKEARITFRVDKKLLDKYKRNVSDMSKDLRQYMERKVNQTTDIEELEWTRLEKIQKRDTLNIEIELLDEEILQAKEKRDENRQNTKLLNYCMETVINLISNKPNKTISREKVEEVANLKNLEPSILIKECKKNGIKFSSTKEECYNSKIVIPEKEREESPNVKLYSKIWTDFRKQRSNGIDKFSKFIIENEKLYIDLGTEYGADYEEVKKYILESYPL